MGQSSQGKPNMFRTEPVSGFMLVTLTPELLLPRRATFGVGGWG
jgi:hypothetical protein